MSCLMKSLKKKFCLLVRQREGEKVYLPEKKQQQSYFLTGMHPNVINVNVRQSCQHAMYDFLNMSVLFLTYGP